MSPQYKRVEIRDQQRGPAAPSTLEELRELVALAERETPPEFWGNLCFQFIPARDEEDVLVEISYLCPMTGDERRQRDEELRLWTDQRVAALRMELSHFEAESARLNK